MWLKCKLNLCPHKPVHTGTHMHLKWFMGTLVFSTLHCRDFLFSIFFLCVHKKHKNANKPIMQITQITFFLLDVFKHILNFCSLICILCFCLVVFLCFLSFLVLLVLFVHTKSFR